MFGCLELLQFVLPMFKHLQCSLTMPSVFPGILQSGCPQPAGDRARREDYRHSDRPAGPLSRVLRAERSSEAQGR